MSYAFVICKYVISLLNKNCSLTLLEARDNAVDEFHFFFFMLGFTTEQDTS